MELRRSGHPYLEKRSVHRTQSGEFSYRKTGTRVKMSMSFLRNACLPSYADCSLVRATVDGRSIGHAITGRWKHDEDVVCWVTQLVVHRDYRSLGVATYLLQQVKEESDAIFGIASSNPLACMAAARAFGGRITYH